MEASDLCKDKNKGISIVNGVLLPCLQIIKQQSDLGVEEDQGKGCSCQSCHCHSDLQITLAFLVSRSDFQKFSAKHS